MAPPGGSAHFRRMRRAAGLVVVLAAACTAASPEKAPAPSAAIGEPKLIAQTSGTTVLLQAVSAVDERIVWVSGRAGTFVRTVDGGAHWEAGRVTGADTLEFRDVEAISADTALLLSAGSGELSRIYRTVDGGRTWSLRYRATEPDAFLDCFDFWTPERGIAFGDALRGEHFLLETTDGGVTWERIPPDRIPPALPGEGSFASSGTCIAASGSRAAFVGLGNTSRTRVIRTADAGANWSVAETPIVSGEAAGIGSVVAFDSMRAVALGGDFGRPQARGTYVARTADGGRTWTAGGVTTFAGAIYGAARVPGAGESIVALGPGGANLSRDGGRTWITLDTLAYWSVDVASPRAGWMVGPGGRIVRLMFD